ncbi:MAG: YbaK/EbsC family protein [Actinomycetota bacterium]|nr:YbaK/EbsC family protein [Actinomycetota bacterium]
MSGDQVVDQLEAIGLAYEIIGCDPALADTAEFCAEYGYDLADSANTILVVGKSNPRTYVACVLLANTRLDVNGLIRKRLGIRRTSFASAEETSEVTGMTMGGVTPFGLPAGLPVWVDSNVMTRQRIVLGGGSRDRKILATPQILQHLKNVEVVPELARTLPVEQSDR